MESQTHCENCSITMTNVRTKGNYNEIFLNNISSETAMMLQQVVAYRDNKLGEIKTNGKIVPRRSKLIYVDF